MPLYMVAQMQKEQIDWRSICKAISRFESTLCSWGDDGVMALWRRRDDHDLYDIVS